MRAYKLTDNFFDRNLKQECAINKEWPNTALKKARKFEFVARPNL